MGCQSHCKRASVLTLRPDIWLFPFLNVCGIFSKAKTSTTINTVAWLPDFVEFTYTRADIEGQYFPYYSETISDKIPFSSNYIQLGGLQEIDFGVLSTFFPLSGGLAD